MLEPNLPFEEKINTAQKILSEAEADTDIKRESLALLLHDIPPHMSKEQTAVSHSSAESDITSNDAGLRMDDLRALQCGECVLETLSCKTAKANLERQKSDRVVPSHSHSDPSLHMQ